MRPGRGLGVIWHAKNRLGLVAQALDSLVVKIDSVHLDLGWQRIRIDGKTMILRGDFHPARGQILHRLIAATMPELELECFSAKRLSQNLMTQTYSKYRH